MSVSIIPTRFPREATVTARLAVTFDLPVPPRKEWTARIFDIVQSLQLLPLLAIRSRDLAPGQVGEQTGLLHQLVIGSGLDHLSVL